MSALATYPVIATTGGKATLEIRPCDTAENPLIYDPLCITTWANICVKSENHVVAPTDFVHEFNITTRDGVIEYIAIASFNALTKEFGRENPKLLAVLAQNDINRLAKRLQHWFDGKVYNVVIVNQDDEIINEIDEVYSENDSIDDLAQEWADVFEVTFDNDKELLHYECTTDTGVFTSFDINPNTETMGIWVDSVTNIGSLNKEQVRGLYEQLHKMFNR